MPLIKKYVWSDDQNTLEKKIRFTKDQWTSIKDNLRQRMANMECMEISFNDASYCSTCAEHVAHGHPEHNLVMRVGSDAERIQSAVERLTNQLSMIPTIFVGVTVGIVVCITIMVVLSLFWILVCYLIPDFAEDIIITLNLIQEFAKKCLVIMLSGDTSLMKMIWDKAYEVFKYRAIVNYH
ncbi:MAG: hypothetical protein MHPSP_004387 [Paramarteilia canceri]